jgi:hypothetical protein
LSDRFFLAAPNSTSVGEDAEVGSILVVAFAGTNFADLTLRMTVLTEPL